MNTNFMWKIFDTRNDHPTFLFHGVGGTRKVPFDQWIEAEVKMVRESVGPRYQSGFHVVNNAESILHWRRSAKNLEGRYACRVLTGAIRKKPTNGKGVFLATYLMLPRECWNQRVHLADLHAVIDLVGRQDELAAA